MSKYVACPGCGVRLMGSICYYKSCLDTAVRLWEWKISARVCSHCCSTSRRDVWSEALPWGAPGLEPAARSQTRALGQRGCWQPERSGSRHRSGKLAFTSQGCPPGCFGEEQKKKNASWNTARFRGRQLAKLVSGVPWALEGKDRGSGRAAQPGEKILLWKLTLTRM